MHEPKNEVTIRLSVTGHRIGRLDPPEEDHEIVRYQVRLSTDGQSRPTARRALTAVTNDWTNWCVHRSQGSGQYDVPGSGNVVLTVELGGNVTDIEMAKTFTVAAESTGGSLLNALNGAVATAEDQAEKWLTPKRTPPPWLPTRKPVGFFERLRLAFAADPRPM